MKTMSLKLGIRDNSELENTLEVTRTSPLTNSTFDNYINFITEEFTNKRRGQETIKYNHFIEVSTIFYNGFNDQGGEGKDRGRGRDSKRGKDRGRGRGRDRGTDNGNFDRNNSLSVNGLTFYPNKRYSEHKLYKITPNQKAIIKEAKRWEIIKIHLKIIHQQLEQYSLLYLTLYKRLCL